MRIIIALLFLANTTLQAQVGIGTTNPDTKAALDISSNSKGLLIPRMTTAQRDAITSPTEGLIVFNSDTKRIEVYNAGSSGEGSVSNLGFFSSRVGSTYSESAWSSSNVRGMAQSFSSAGGLLTAISISVASIESNSTSPSYVLSIYSGTPSPTCGYSTASSSTCGFSSFGAPLATSLVSISQLGVNKLYLNTPIYLVSGQTYTFSITATTTTQQFYWEGQTAYANGASYGINGSISGSTDDFTFLTQYAVGWRAL